MPIEYVTEAEAKAFAVKLASFGEQLSAKEQALLREILMRAAHDEEDVEGHSEVVNPIVVGQAIPAALVLLHDAHTHLHMISQHVLATLPSPWPHLPHHPGR